MTNDNDLIRRGDAIDAMCKGPRTVQERIDMIRALPAVAASQPDDPVTNADSRQRVTAYLARRKKSAQTVYEEVHSYDVGCDGEVVLLASDIEALLAPRDAQIAALVEAAERSAEGWSNAIELDIILPQHRTVAGVLRDDLRAALAAVKGGDA